MTPSTHPAPPMTIGNMRDTGVHHLGGLAESDKTRQSIDLSRVVFRAWKSRARVAKHSRKRRPTYGVSAARAEAACSIVSPAPSTSRIRRIAIMPKSHRGAIETMLVGGRVDFAPVPTDAVLGKRNVTVLA